MDRRYAREKIGLLVRDLDSYSDDEFWRQMSRIASGATGRDHAEDIAKQRDQLREALDGIMNNSAPVDQGEFKMYGEAARKARAALKQTENTNGRD